MIQEHCVTYYLAQVVHTGQRDFVLSVEKHRERNYMFPKKDYFLPSTIII